MLRVAQVITRFIAGAGGVALRGALALDPDVYSVSIISAPGGPLLAEAERAGLEVVLLDHMNPEINPVEDYRCLHELEEKLGDGHFDLVHTHSAKAGALGRIAARRARIPGVVHTFHGFPFHNFQSWPLRMTYVEIERRLGRMTDQFLAVGGAVAAQAISLKIASPERIRTIASAIDVNVAPVSQAGRTEARRLMGLPMDAPVVGTVGRLAPQKAPQDMVAAMEAIGRAGVYCVWIGSGPLLRDTADLIQRKGLAGRFLLLGERNDVAALLPGFDVFALASRYEGIPCSLVEAITCGIPVVATAVNAVPEVVVPGRTGMLVPPSEPKLLARAIAFLLDHPEQGERMADAARVLIGDRFHPAILGQDLAITYELALRGRSSSFRRPLGLVANA
jgi:glycosyltransferase involved in cell wall biosynthesis